MTLSVEERIRSEVLRRHSSASSVIVETQSVWQRMIAKFAPKSNRCRCGRSRRRVRVFVHRNNRKAEIWPEFVCPCEVITLDEVISSQLHIN